MEKELDLKESFDFYDQTYLKTYNLNKSIRYQLNLLDSLDMFTRKHSENVATVTCNLCKKLHCTKGFTEYCVTCAYIHDIGKMFISQNILQKNGKLTDEEFEIMKTHTTLGYQLCLKDKALRPYYAGPYYHHEALDGTGYPQGLLKKDIPYEAQIIRVADEFDAIVSKRQYKSHINISDALKIIIENTQPSPNAHQGTGFTNAGKNNKLVVKKLISVVLDDTEYEIACTMNYIKYLEEIGILQAEKQNSESELLDSNLKVKAKGIIAQINDEKNYIKIRENDEYKYYNFKLEQKESKEILATNTLFLSKKDGKYGFVNEKGIVVVDYQYEDATEQNKYGYAAVKKDGKWGCIDSKGKVIEECKNSLENALVVDFIASWHLATDINANYYTK